MKYEVHDKSRFAGAGHEYHCLDYSESEYCQDSPRNTADDAVF